jgi:hypothetical protein
MFLFHPVVAIFPDAKDVVLLMVWGSRQKYVAAIVFAV